MVQCVKRGSIESEWDQPVDDVKDRVFLGNFIAFNTYEAYNALYLEQPRDQKELEMYGMAYFNVRI